MKKSITRSLIASSSLLFYQAQAQIEVIEVTATRRPEVAQDVPIALRALSMETLEQLDIRSFSDYLAHMPGLTAGGSGPGQARARSISAAWLPPRRPFPSPRWRG